MTGPGGPWSQSEAPIKDAPKRPFPARTNVPHKFYKGSHEGDPLQGLMFPGK